MEAIISFFSVRPVFFAALLLFLPFAFLWNYSRRRKAVHLSPETARKQLPAGFTLTDYIKAFISWLFLFMPIYHVRPGLYYIGKKDDKTPLLVTANNFLFYRPFLLAETAPMRLYYGYRHVKNDYTGMNMRRKRENDETQKIFLAKEVAKLVISRYPRLSLYDVKSALMSAEQFVIDTMYYNRKNEMK